MQPRGTVLTNASMTRRRRCASGCPIADATADKATIRGGTVLAPPYDVPGFREAILADSQGAVFTVSQLTGFR
jgi:predicted enzyme related to lactoylglutathione lyase